jgi:sigma-B regulation protein RsbU (phosphoserine phosphatase)
MIEKEKLFNIITLNFYDKQTEKEFTKEYADQSARIVRMGLLLGSITFILVGFLLDKKSFPDSPQILFPWRIAGASIMVTTSFLLGFRSVRKQFQPLLLISLTLVATAIMKTAITYNEGGLYNTSIAITAYIIFIHTLSRVKFLYSSVFTWSFIIVYLLLLFNLDMPDVVVTQTVVFFIVVNLFGMSASYGIEFSIRDAFVKSKLLQESRKLLEKEHKRTSQELASVKELQLSMLPENAPSLKNIDVAFHMSTATEVGGDYCDYIIGEDGFLTFAIGDATGQGARASTMVMAIKILFTEYASKETVKGFLRHASTTIKSLNLPKLYMTLAFGNISGDKLELSGAGIPEALLYKSDKKIIEKISLKGIPLGSYIHFDYEAKEYLLNPGDVLILMTDGVTELHNSKGEMYETKQIEEQLKEYSELSAQEILDHLVEGANRWRDEQSLHDDMTMLVLKIKH